MSKFNVKIVALLLCIQVIAGLYAAEEDLRRPFSKLYTVDSLIKEVPQNRQTVTDYWAMNAVSAYTKQGMYCIDLRKNVSFILWGADIKALTGYPYRYSGGAGAFFEKQNTNEVYMISTGNPEMLKDVDTLFFTKYNVSLVDKRTGAIEKGSNLYLYRILKPQ